MKSTDENATPFSGWAIVEVMGHARYAGLVSEERIAGIGFVRIDVPAAGCLPAYTKFLGGASIFAITPTDEATAMRAAAGFRAPAIQPYLLAAPTGFDSEDDLDELEDE